MTTKHIERCKRLRKSQTDAEAKLWSILRNRRLGGIKFRRQHPIGKYILDFYCPAHKLAIEADGGQHYDDNGRREDEARTKILSKHGVRIIRFSDLDILNDMEGVYEAILKEIERGNDPPSSPPFPPRARGGGWWFITIFPPRK